MTPAENRVLDIRAVQRDRWEANSTYQFVTFDEIDIDPPAKDWLIKGIFAKGETSAWIGPPGSLKSALLAEASVAVAAGLDWHSHRNKGAMGVVYFALERADLVKRRMRAYRQRLGIDSAPIAVSNAVVELSRPESFKRFVDTIRHARTVLHTEIGFVIIDTHSKLVAAGGGDENSAKDQNTIFASIARVKASCPAAHVALVGHTGKDESRGARGSNALLGDVDLMVTISGEAVKTATVTKANDAPEGPLFSFKSEVHEFGTDPDGDPITVNIVEPADAVAVTPSQQRLTANQQTFYRLLHDAGTNGLTLEDWNSQAKALGIGTNRKATLHDLRKALEDRNMVREYGGRWKVAHP